MKVKMLAGTMKSVLSKEFLIRLMEHLSVHTALQVYLNWVIER